MKRYIFFLILICIVFTSIAQNRYALVIGNASYANSPLKNPINDAVAISESLKRLKFDVITVKDGDIITMQRALNEFSVKIKNDPGSVRLFYYSGHGSQLEGKNYLMPINISFRDDVDFKYNTLCVDNVVDKMKTNDSKSINIIILDACRTNPIMRGFSKDAKEGLTRVQAPSNSIVCFATLEDQTASDNSHGQNGLFTQELLKYIQAENVELTKVFKLVAKSVNELSNYGQQPAIYSSMNDDFYFIGDGNGEHIIYKPTNPIVIKDRSNDPYGKDENSLNANKKPCEINNTSSICFDNKYSTSIELLCYTVNTNNVKIGLEKLMIPSNSTSCYYDIKGNIINFEIYKMSTWGILEKIYSSSAKLNFCEQQNIIISSTSHN